VDSGEATHRLLVYEFMPNKTLDDHLFNRAHPPLSWRMRLQIMVGAGRGLDYLHEGVPEVQVVLFYLWKIIIKFAPASLKTLNLPSSESASD
jgi:hypothetical protein